MHTFLPRTPGGALAALLVAGLVSTGDLSGQTVQRLTGDAGIGTKRGITTAPLSLGTRQLPLYEASVAPPAIEYNVFDSLFNAFSYYTGDAEPIWWDQYSNTLVTVKRGFTGNSDNLYIRHSTDMGATWSNPVGPLHEPSLGFARYPSVMVINKDKSADRSNLLYYFTFPGLINEEFGIFFQGFLDATFVPLSPPDISQGVVQGSTTLTWSTGSKSTYTADGSVVLTAGELAENNLGIRRFDLNSGNLTSTIPPTWASDNFSDPGTPDSRTSLNLGMGRDDNGTLYSGIYSRFPENEATRRIHPYPGVSTSTDGGVTWSDIDVMPIDVIRAYAETQGANPDSVIFPYNTAQDFQVIGNGKVTFALNLFESNADKDDAEVVQQVVEVTKDGSTWTIRKIADISGRNFTFDPIAPETTRENQLGNELQIARTADGTGYLAKWVDLISYIFEQDITDDGQAPDTITSSDVFVAVRKEGSNTWSQPLNITESPIIDRITWITDVIPSDFRNIPLITLQGKISDDLASVADMLTSLQLNAEAEQYVTSQTFDASSLAGVTTPVTTSGSGVVLGAVYPNPAVADASISFTLPTSGDVTLELWNTAGEKVGTLLSGHREGGAHQVKVAASELPAGAYLYRLRFNGETLSRMFTVVH